MSLHFPFSKLRNRPEFVGFMSQMPEFHSSNCVLKEVEGQGYRLVLEHVRSLLAYQVTEIRSLGEGEINFGYP